MLSSIVILLLFSPFTPIFLAAFLVTFYLYPYFVTYAHLRPIPAPFLAAFSNLWLLMQARRGHRSEALDEVHRRLGPIVRVQPNHVSVASEEAIGIIYGHGNGFLKSDFYDAFVALHSRGLFNTRDRVIHSRKRKMVAHTFAPMSVQQFEPYIRANLALFVKQWDRLIDEAPATTTTATTQKSAHLDCLEWFNYLAFDMIGDLAFGQPFGMLAQASGITETRATPDSPAVQISAVEVINRRGDVSATLGCLPALKPWAPWLPDRFFRQGVAAVNALTGIAVARVKERLEVERKNNQAGDASSSPFDPGKKGRAHAPPTPPLTDDTSLNAPQPSPTDRRTDLLARLMEARDANGQAMGWEELTVEALTQLIAGSDTTSNSSCALLFHAVRTPGVMARLQAELDAAVVHKEGEDEEAEAVPTFAQVRDLPYLQAVLNETLRHHSPSSLGLPRVVPRECVGGVRIGEYVFPPGTVLGVPMYTVHHDREVWGEDADEFRPERWLTEEGGGLTARQKKAFNPFSHGPRACVGRNVAEMEMKLIAATWIWRYDVILRQAQMQSREGFLRKPLGVKIAISKRRP